MIRRVRVSFFENFNSNVCHFFYPYGLNNQILLSKIFVLLQLETYFIGLNVYKRCKICFYSVLNSFNQFPVTVKRLLIIPFQASHSTAKGLTKIENHQ